MQAETGREVPVEIDRASDRPVYKQLADALRAVIRSGELKAGKLLPSETQLMARYEVSRNSARTAMGLLRVEGLVITEQGRGSFVRERRPLQPLNSSPYSNTLRPDGEADQQVLRAEVVDPPAEVADRLGLRPAERALFHRYLLLVGGEAVQLADDYVPLDVAEAPQRECWVDEVTFKDARSGGGAVSRYA